MFVPNQGVGNIFNATESVLYLFAPTRNARLAPQAHRPLMYNFDENFGIAAAQAVEQTFANGNNLALKQLVQSDVSAGMVVPSLAPDTMINLSSMSDRWRFVMVINDPRPLGTAVQTSKLIKNRVIVMGWFSDEPVNPLTMYTHPTINPNAQAFISHKTVVERFDTYGHGGMGVPRIMTRVDNQIVRSDVISALSSDPHLCFTDPASTYRGLTYTPEGQSITFPSEITNGLSQTAGEPRALRTEFADPNTNLFAILDSTSKSYRDILANNTAGNFSGDAWGATGLATDTFADVMQSNLDSNIHPSAILGPNEGEFMTMDVLVRRYNPEITPIIPEDAIMFGTVNQADQTASMVFSDLLTSSVPAIMGRYGLASIIMNYQSYPAGIGMAADPDKLEIVHVETLVPMSGDMIRSRVDGLMMDLRNGVFRTMRLAHGDFFFSLSVNTAGMAHVQLTFEADAATQMAPYEKPVCFDGLITSLIGTRDACSGNTSSMNALMNAIGNDYTIQKAPTQQALAPIHQDPYQQPPQSNIVSLS